MPAEQLGDRRQRRQFFFFFVLVQLRIAAHDVAFGHDAFHVLGIADDDGPDLIVGELVRGLEQVAAGPMVMTSSAA